jgi:hypothetical protein
MLRDERATSTSSSPTAIFVESAPRIAPASRRRRVSLRVSTSAIPTTSWRMR